MTNAKAFLISALSVASCWPTAVNARAFANHGVNVTTFYRERPDKSNPEKMQQYEVIMGVSPHVFNLPNTSDNSLGKRYEVGTSLEFPSTGADEHDLEEAMRCLEEQFCSMNSIAPSFKISCSVGNMMAYACNYVDAITKNLEELLHFMWLDLERKGQNPCSVGEMRAKREELRTEKGVGLGWWYEPDWAKLYGWDVKGAEVCGNMRTGQFQFRMTCETCECQLWENFTPWRKTIPFA